MRIVTVVGARPQFIKAAAVSRPLRAGPAVEEILIHTGQHYDDNMSDVFFDELGIPRPDYHLQIGSAPHGEQTGRMLAAIERVLVDTRPDWVLVYGDTNSTLAGALAAAKLHVPVAHVEAGVRSFNRLMPEEINRVLTDHAADLLLAPTKTAIANLRREGINSAGMHCVGDVMYDVALHYGQAAARDTLADCHVEPGRFVLATIHRAENTDDSGRLRAIFEGLGQVATQLPVILPLHPRTRRALDRAGLLEQAHRRLRIVPPVGYLDMITLERNARLVATDSGGVQKEAFFHGVLCVTLRSETEWVELVEQGWNRVVDPVSAEVVCDGIHHMLSRVDAKPPRAGLYGGGRAAERIVELLAA